MNGNGISPEKHSRLKMQAIHQHERLRNGLKGGGTYLNASRAAASSYFELGSTRNTAHDEEFFHCFVQYLDEAIKKLKDQGTTADIEGEILDDYGNEAE